MPRVWKRWRVAWLIAAATSALAIWLSWPLASSAALLLDLARSDAWARRLLPVGRDRVAIENIMVPTRHGAVRARQYTPASRPRRSLLVVPGIHAGGVDEPRLAAFTQRLAEAGALVLSVPLPALRAYRITPASTDIIEDAVLWMAGRHELTSTDRVGVIGVSFAGGLALVAAGRPSLEGKLTAVVSLGGHADLPRVMTYLCTGRLPDGTVRPSHDYGVAIILRSAIPHLVPADQVQTLDAALVTFLDASGSAGTDPDRATTLFATARSEGDQLADPARTLMRWVNDRNVVELGPRLLPWVEALGGDPALSPERSPATKVPVFVIHGRDDNVIPSSETPLLAAYLTRHGNAQVRTLLTPLVTHADLQPTVPFGDGWRLVRFWAAVWSALD